MINSPSPCPRASGCTAIPRLGISNPSSRPRSEPYPFSDQLSLRFYGYFDVAPLKQTSTPGKTNAEANKHKFVTWRKLRRYP